MAELGQSPPADISPRLTGVCGARGVFGDVLQQGRAAAGSLVEGEGTPTDDNHKFPLPAAAPCTLGSLPAPCRPHPASPLGPLGEVGG